MSIPDELKEMAERAQSGQQARTTVRHLLSLFGMYRRTYQNVRRIREALDVASVVTEPDFEATYIDGGISIKPKDDAPASSETDAIQELSAEVSETLKVTGELSVVRTVGLPEPAHRIMRLESANKPPLSVPPDDSIEHAVTLMLRHDYSQLPVMQTPTAREVKGLFSWKSVGTRLAIGRECSHVGDSMDRCQIISSDASLFDAIKIIAADDCVLVRANDKTICGIVTAYDISAQFQQLAEAFLLLGDIENHVRYLIGNSFAVEQLQQAKDPEDNDRDIQSVFDLTFGEYVRLLQKEENWAQLNVKIDRKTFTAWLDKVREVRNDVMHFDPDPMDPADLCLLRDIAGFLVRLQQTTS